MRRALIALAALLLAGCYPTPVQPDEVDTARLEALAAESVLAGGESHPAEANNTSANANAKRAYVSAERQWNREAPWPAATELLAELRADDWIVVLQNCKASESGLSSAQLVALKELDEFTAGVVVKLDSDGALLEAYAPFHEEETNPWGPLDAQTDGCLDEPVEPVTNTTTNSRTTVGLFYFRDE